MSRAETWKQVAWNGICFKAPAEWEVGQIGSRHLILEDQTGPVMEVKWAEVKGTFSHKAHLKRLAAVHSRKKKGHIAEWFLPPHWQTALADYDASGFLWQGHAAGSRGAILFCPLCRKAALIQFFEDSSAEREKILLAVLRSFRDHRQDGLAQWAIFDIRVTLPQTMRLLRFRFDVGKYEIVFTEGAQTIHLHRWAPAAALLAGRDLVDFARLIPEFAADLPRAENAGACGTLEWQVSPATAWHRRLGRLKLKPSFYWFRLWREDEKNRILGVRAESKRPFDAQGLIQICRNYESL